MITNPHDTPSRIWFGDAIAAALRDYRWPDEVADISTYESPDAAPDGDPRLTRLIHSWEVMRLPWPRCAVRAGYSSAAAAKAAYYAHRRATGRLSGVEAAKARADADPRTVKLVHCREVLGLTWARCAEEAGYSAATSACAAYKAYLRRRAEEQGHAAD